MTTLRNYEQESKQCELYSLMYKRMLKDFMNHLERRDSRSGWSIVSKPSYETTNIRKFC